MIVRVISTVGIGVILLILKLEQWAFYAPRGVCQTMYGTRVLVDVNEYPIMYHRQ
jgi:hypothetical protein